MMVINEKEFRVANDSEIRAEQLNVLDVVLQFCEKNSIKCFLYYGSLLGAIRHKGYIPWDDDIDIGMLREDYDRFIELFSHDNIKVYDQTLVEKYPFYFAKICNTDTVIVEEMGKSGYEYGLGIDLFPLDNIPKDELLRKKMLSSIKVRKNIRNIKAISFSKKRVFWKKMVIALGNTVFGAISMSSLVKGMKKSVDKYKECESEEVADIMLPYGERSIVKSSWFDKVKMVDFENLEVPIPTDYDKILSQIYGDYMTPPSDDKKASTHHFKAYIKKHY